MGAGRPAGGHRLAWAGLLAGGLAVAVSATTVAAVTAQGRAPGLPAVQAQSLTVTTVSELRSDIRARTRRGNLPRGAS